MSCTILVIDSGEKHRQVLRRFIEKAYPGVELVEHDPSVFGMMARNSDWSKYQLIIIDNELEKEDGLAWVRTVKQLPDFPPVIFVSSMSDPGSARATQAVIGAIKLGAENFLFKKGISARQLSSSILSVLKATGYDPSAAIRERQATPQADPEQAGDEKTLGTISQEIELSMKDTVLEMELSMAMLYGYAEWPFSMRDILAGNARIGNYKITSYLGKSGHITTFKAKATKGATPVIIKMLGQPSDKHSEVYQKALRDLTDALQWDHPNLIRYIDHQVIDDRMIIVREFLDGGKLSEILVRKGVTEEQAIRYILQILSALAHLHDHGIVVGEIIPDTLMFRDPDTLVITNMGIIDRLGPIDDTGAEHPLDAQLCYTTPEKAQGRQIDSRSDLYISGVILYEMLAGHPPFHRGSIQDILYAHASQPVPDLPDKKHPMNRVIQGLLMKTPSQRYQTAKEVSKVIAGIYEK